MNEFKNNVGHIFMYKSTRKNSKCSDIITIRHLISHDHVHGYIDENTITGQIINAVDNCIYAMKLLNTREIIITCYLTIGHETVYTNANSELYHHISDIHIDTYRKQYYSVEQLINFLYERFMLIYPYSKLDIKDLYNEPSIKAAINRYYLTDATH